MLGWKTRLEIFHMLPDFPKLKSEINEVINLFFRSRIEQHTIAIKQTPKTRIFEGKNTVIRRNSGEEDPTNFMSSEAEINIKFDEIPNMTFNDILSKLDNAAQDLAGKMETNFFKTLSEELDRKNRTFDNKGQPLTGKVILKTLENMFIPFDEKGNAEMPSIFIGPKLTEKMPKALQELEEDPTLKEEFKELMVQKKEQWHAEQASRKLVG